jgi:hypothetical protein
MRTIPASEDAHPPILCDPLPGRATVLGRRIIGYGKGSFRNGTRHVLRAHFK